MKQIKKKVFKLITLRWSYGFDSWSGLVSSATVWSCWEIGIGLKKEGWYWWEIEEGEAWACWGSER